MRDEVKMDANRLIAEVYKRPALWNQRHISYHNREVTNRVWMEIASIFKLPTEKDLNCITSIKSKMERFARYFSSGIKKGSSLSQK
ncbi:uncharacterized protein LOC726661 [Apis mellifera]|uniref:Uncharacterized protein LOC726661 n=1 Tax=Apis mellifera TaxID=7460 RepID=A0A7M7MLK8_APIME|nr:uncharacterized protein LOC726661 [Apis mellifera]|eukprot:XP_026297742.1 uncharacterized protein LOC726661 [Apis mellifera]